MQIVASEVSPNEVQTVMQHSPTLDSSKSIQSLGKETTASEFQVYQRTIGKLGGSA
jgi:hypothetical protein